MDNAPLSEVTGAVNVSANGLMAEPLTQPPDRPFWLTVHTCFVSVVGRY